MWSNGKLLSTLCEVSCPDPTQLTWGEGVSITSPNCWASSRSMERPIKSQSSVYWNNVEVRTILQLQSSKRVMRFIIQHRPICNSTLTITRLQHFCKPKDSGLWHQTLEGSLMPRPLPGKRVWCSEWHFLSHGVGAYGVKNVIFPFYIWDLSFLTT